MLVIGGYGGAEGHALGRRRCAIRFSARQDRQLPVLVSLTLARGEVPVMMMVDFQTVGSTIGGG